jgi:hypothetical protein
VIVASYLLAVALAPSGTPAECQSHAADQVVVCASPNRDSPYRLPKLPEKYRQKRIVAATELAPGVHAAAHVEAAEMPDHQKSNRMMLTIGVGF